MYKRLNCLTLIAAVMVFIGCGSDSPEFEDFDPGEATLIAPLNNTECISGEVLDDLQSEVYFNWGKALNTETYTLILLDLISGEESGYSTSDPGLKVVLKRATPYQWYIISTNAKSNKLTKSERWNFYNAGEANTNYAPFPAEVIYPEDEMRITTNDERIELRWRGLDLDDDIVKYEVYFEDATPPQTMFESSEEALDVRVMSGVTYYWNIISIDKEGNTSESIVQSFTIE
ncbi:hypothetical protein [Robertkochia solimangrovi]|uniref:hypothetical protein n=1 Tax=Robertkochia solimangrovi TaxID=2213046 RepID=UPI00117EFE09|nr:hypothetical protein [Robertkochia solimangrovi]TRZ44331.1 hypothetical protein DMZ48_07415 [Robertkochia solimangrovi]